MVSVGYVDEPEVSAKPKLLPLTLNAFAEQDMDDRVMAVPVLVKMKLRQANEANLKLCLPWGPDSGGNWNLNPTTLGQGLYQFATAVKLHPIDVVSTDHSQDITLPAAVPIQGLSVKGNGVKDFVIDFEFKAYPDRTQLPAIVCAYLGVDPA
jgi:hypothetical protein